MGLNSMPLDFRHYFCQGQMTWPRANFSMQFPIFQCDQTPHRQVSGLFLGRIRWPDLERLFWKISMDFSKFFNGLFPNLFKKGWVVDERRQPEAPVPGFDGFLLPYFCQICQWKFPNPAKKCWFRPWVTTVSNFYFTPAICRASGLASYYFCSLRLRSSTLAPFMFMQLFACANREL